MTTHLDLCSGIGGFALAARWLGIETVGFCEIDPWCRRVLAKNFPGVPHHDDVTTLSGDRVRGWIASVLDDPESQRFRDGTNGANQGQAARNVHPIAGAGVFDGTRIGILTAGYPCQPFSLAGKRLGAEDDRHLWPYIAALVADLRPTWCLFENVAGHITMGLDDVLSDLEEIGYACQPVVVPACAVNAPHRRDRVWIMARTTRGATTHASGSSCPAGTERSRRDELGRGGDESSLADTTDRGIRRGIAPGESGLVACSGEVVAVSNHRGRDGWTDVKGEGPSERGRTFSNSRREAQSGLGEPDDGIPGRLDERRARPWDGGWEDGVPRVTDGCTDRVNKLKALGNAIVPEVAYVLMASMMEAPDTS